MRSKNKSILEAKVNDCVHRYEPNALQFMNNFCRHSQIAGVEGSVIQKGWIRHLLVRGTLFKP